MLMPEQVVCHGAPAPEVREREYLASILKPGMNFWDIGANAGLYSMVALSYGCNVLAIEPNFVPLELFVQNVNESRGAFNREWPNQTVTLLTCAISDVDGSARMKSGTHHNAASLGKPGGGAAGPSHSEIEMMVSLCTLDTLYTHFGLPDVIKIDGNGAEPLILSGGYNLFRECRPIIMCKFDKTHGGLPPSVENLDKLPSFYHWKTLSGELVEKDRFKSEGHQNLIATPTG